ncbi:hypothetical protein BDF19DRAFT_415646 [Syncephalis fuscata]|nr:hypothetical protein BDF19DRAFT_415646 [Syncephalis fuscata]
MKRHTKRDALAASKKVRFEGTLKNKDYEDDPEDFDHESQLEERKTRRGAVKVEGYNNQSSESEDNEENNSDDDQLTRRDIEEEEEEEQQQPSANDDVDMFADESPAINDSTPVAKNNRRKKGKAAKNGLDGEDDNEDGQDYASYDYYDPSAGDFKIEAFNLRNELEEGKFDESGTYVQNDKDPQRFHDSWLEGVSEKEINKAHEAHARREREMRQRLAQEEQEISDAAGATRAAQLDLLDYLHDDETVNTALKRLGGGTKRKKFGTARKNKQRSLTTKQAMDDTEADTATEAERRRDIELLTGLCDRLMSLGQLDVYDWTADQIKSDLQRQNVTLSDNTAALMEQAAQSEFTMAETVDDSANDGRQWQFKWTSDATEVHGPHTTAEIRAWSSHGYFNAGVLIKRLDEAEFYPLANANIV